MVIIVEQDPNSKQHSKPNVDAILILTLILHLTQLFVSISEFRLMRLETWNNMLR